MNRSRPVSQQWPCLSKSRQVLFRSKQYQTVNCGTWNKFLENMIKYTGVKEQGSAVWLPSDVKKRLDDFRATAKRNIPIRTLVSAIVVAFLDENEGKLKEL